MLLIQKLGSLFWIRLNLTRKKLKTVKTSKKRWCYLVKLVVVVALDDWLKWCSRGWTSCISPSPWMIFMIDPQLNMLDGSPFFVLIISDKDGTVSRGSNCSNGDAKCRLFFALVCGSSFSTLGPPEDLKVDAIQTYTYAILTCKSKLIRKYFWRREREDQLGHLKNGTWFYALGREMGFSSYSRLIQ